MSADIETIEDTLAYKLGMLAAHQMVIEALGARAMTHKTALHLDRASECLLIANEVIKPLWMDASREASGLHCAALENKA